MSASLCIVAGAGPGMGLALARRFARGGHKVALIARDAANAAALAEQTGPDAIGVALNLTDFDAVNATLGGLQRAHGPAEVLVYNAGTWNEVPAMQMPPRDFHADLALTLTGGVACAQAVYPGMKAAGRGTILFTGGGLALYPQTGKGVAALTAGKSAVRGFVHAFAEEAKDDGIHVGSVIIAGAVGSAPGLMPDVIAERFWELHSQPREAWQGELVHTGQ